MSMAARGPGRRSLIKALVLLGLHQKILHGICKFVTFPEISQRFEGFQRNCLPGLLAGLIHAAGKMRTHRQIQDCRRCGWQSPDKLYLSQFNGLKPGIINKFPDDAFIAEGKRRQANFCPFVTDVAADGIGDRDIEGWFGAPDGEGEAASRAQYPPDFGEAGGFVRNELQAMITKDQIKLSIPECQIANIALEPFNGEISLW